MERRGLEIDAKHVLERVEVHRNYSGQARIMKQRDALTMTALCTPEVKLLIILSIDYHFFDVPPSAISKKPKKRESSTRS